MWEYRGPRKQSKAFGVCKTTVVESQAASKEDQKAPLRVLEVLGRP